jgi:hypothetical protein
VHLDFPRFIGSANYRPVPLMLARRYQTGRARLGLHISRYE